MKTELLLSPADWAEKTFGQVLLHDVRRTRRAVKAASVMVRDASASLPKQQHTWKEVKALYRLLDEPDVSFAALMQPHWSQTRTEMQEHPITLLIQDTTELDLTHRHSLSGMGQIGDGNGRGLLLQTVLAVVPQSREIIGCARQEPFVRQAAPKARNPNSKKKASQRNGCVDAHGHRDRKRRSRLLAWVHVGDPRADFFDFFRACQKNKVEFLVRATQERRIQGADERIGSLLVSKQTVAVPSQASLSASSKSRTQSPSDRTFDFLSTHGLVVPSQ